MFEYEFFDGDHFIIFDIIDVDEENDTVTHASNFVFLNFCLIFFTFFLVVRIIGSSR